MGKALFEDHKVISTCSAGHQVEVVRQPDVGKKEDKGRFILMDILAGREVKVTCPACIDGEDADAFTEVDIVHPPKRRASWEG